MSRIAIADPDVGEREFEWVRDVLASGRLADGPAVREFERRFADYCRADHGVAVANGTAALQTALEAVGVGEGDAVVTTPFSFVASANAVRLCGARPVFADVDATTYTLDPEAVEDALAATDDVAAILPVHLYGLPAAMGRLAEIAEEHGVALIEDAAQAHGAAYEGTPVGTFGDAGCFSFYPTKNMTTGEGGMVVTDDREVADRAARFVNHGRADAAAHGYDHVSVGHNLRMTSLAAGIGVEQLRKLPAYNERRRRNATRLSAALEGVTELVLPTEPPDRRHVYHQYTVRCPDRAAFRDHLDERGVDTAVYYPTLIPDQPAYDGYEASVPTASRVADEVVSLPIHPGLDDGDVDRVAAAVCEHYGRPVAEVGADD
ncbi:aminotransferase class I/II-fold pyridoxal phosphate-dependent enzyme [Halorubrum sp. CBA1125]|uniref:DegT/DnrJ/EryC1/StrS family aminotransferase n=1 Tax=Halorubrum sp. CBA1125 TaxID=2668072 RepID=UPI0012E90937|nr:DegT/DnrJ/EryC1/StrS family aminotransferase [Halorubrum sp. CBA1125]MUW14924.1 aminotransferase class I/II-fold pyridoxal phosphate-dependent enzyme [Halorubrum sp. CBA1125]